MFAYFTKMNGTNIITYTHDMARLYFDEDDCDRGSSGNSGSSDSSCSGDNEYLFNNKTIAYWTTYFPPEEIVVRYEDTQLSPPLFSYC